MGIEWSTKREVLRQVAQDNKGEYVCYYCGRVFAKTFDGYEAMTFDHKEPQTKKNDPNHKADHSANNLVLSCKGCNSAKGDRYLFRKGNEDKLEIFKIYRIHRKLRS